jgi:hypothetical protein
MRVESSRVEVSRVETSRIERIRINLHWHNIPLSHYFTRVSLETISRDIKTLIEDDKCDNVFVKHKSEFNIVLQS